MTPTLHALFAAALVLSSSRLPSAPSRIDGRLDDPIWALGAPERLADPPPMTSRAPGEL